MLSIKLFQKIILDQIVSWLFDKNYSTSFLTFVCLVLCSNSTGRVKCTKIMIFCFHFHKKFKIILPDEGFKFLFLLFALALLSNVKLTTIFVGYDKVKSSAERFG